MAAGYWPDFHPDIWKTLPGHLGTGHTGHWALVVSLHTGSLRSNIFPPAKLAGTHSGWVSLWFNIQTHTTLKYKFFQCATKTRKCIFKLLDLLFPRIEKNSWTVQQHWYWETFVWVLIGRMVLNTTSLNWTSHSEMSIEARVNIPLSLSTSELGLWIQESFCS